MARHTFTFSVYNPAALTPLETFALTDPTLLSTGFAEFSIPTLNIMQNQSYPFDATYASTQVPEPWNEVQMLDWSHMMDRDPVTKRYYVSGGRPSTSGRSESHLSLKLVEYNEFTNAITVRDQWAANSWAGHTDRSTTVMTQPQLVAYHPHNASSYGLRVFTWDIENNVEGPELPTPPSNLGGFSSSYSGRMFLCWFPTMGAQGSLIYADSTWWRCSRYDWAQGPGGVWEALTPGNFSSMPFGAGQQHINGHYHPIANRMLLGNSGGTGSSTESRLIIVSPNATAALTRNTCPISFTSGGGTTGGPVVPHSTLPLSILFSRRDGHVWTFDWRIEDSGSGEPWQDRGTYPTQIYSTDSIALPHPSGGGIAFFKYGTNGTSKCYYWKEPSSWT